VTARVRLLRARRRLAATLMLRALLTAAAAAIVVRAIAGRLVSPETVTGLTVLAAAIAGMPLLAAVGRVRSLERVALWIEEGYPALQYAVVALAGEHASPALERQALAVHWGGSAARLVRLVAWPMLAFGLALIGALAVSSVRSHGAESSAREGPGTSTTPARSLPLAHLRVTVAPPVYAHRATVSIDDPTSIDALVASVITVRGVGDAGDVRASIDSTTRSARSRDDGWTVTLAMPARPALLRLRDRGRERLVVLSPVIDAAPGVALRLPARDSVVRRATGRLRLLAQLHDDIGLHDARFELVISSGQGENFTVRTAIVGRRLLGDAPDATLDASLLLDSLALQPGDVLQLRAVARDGNIATGPGVGSSDTRSIRVARAGEYDSLSVEQAPPGDPEGQLLGERMLITLTEALDRRRARIPRATLLTESSRIAADQARLRTRVGDIVFQRLGGEPLGEESTMEHGAAGLTPAELLKRADAATNGSAGAAPDVEGDETPILAVNRPLLEAFNAMWEAGRSLELGETSRALPAMRRALAAIERARQAERIYLRGRPAAVVVDIANVRLSGTTHGATAVLPPRPPADPTSRRRAEAFARATALLAREPTAAADTLLVMRVDALGDAPALASALDEAARAVLRGDAAAIGLAWSRVRRAMGPPPVAGNSAALWTGAP
jgi:hypothetical protein